MKFRIAYLLKNIYPYSWIPSHTSPCWKVGPEFLILSKEPIINKHHENLRDLIGWDAFSEKKICGFNIRNTFICCSHFDSTNEECKKKNIQQTRDFIQKHAPI